MGDRRSRVREVSERRKLPSGAPSESAGAAEALEESEARYRTLFEQSPIAVFTFDRMQRLTDCNMALVRLLKSSYEKLIGLDLRSLDDARIFPAVEKVLEGEPLYFEGSYRAQHSDAEIAAATWLTPLRDGDGEVIGGLGLVEDVTARRRAQDALARSEANFRALIENAPDAVGVIRNSGVHLYVNRKLAQLLGYERDELMKMSAVEVMHEEDVPRFAERNRRRDRGEALPSAEYRLKHRDGRLLSVETTTMRVQFDGGVAILAMIRDLTERKRMQAQLLLSDRLASVGVLAAGIAHEINNPLAFVMANLEVLAKKALPEMLLLAHDDAERGRIARVAEMVEQSHEGSERMRRIVRDVKTFARGGDETREPVDVQASLDAALQLVAHELRRRARVVRDFAPVPKVEASESRLGQVFLNLLVNALQALPESGENEVRVRISAPDDATVLVEVIDTGEGIPADVLSRVFDPFFTTKPIGVGTGLGLFVCQGIVASLGGALSIVSEVGKGTTVSVSLPAITTPSDRAPSGPPSSMSGAVKTSRVLVIDDEPSLGRALAAALSGEHDVTFVTSGNAAIDLLATDDRFDVVLCDLMMPDVSGMDVWTRVRASRPDLAARFVFVTGGVFTAETAAFLDGSKPYLDKPFDMPKLRALLRQRAKKSV
jgi:PAS domain S-box-containing protein